jgi:hypothetical protein
LTATVARIALRRTRTEDLGEHRSPGSADEFERPGSYLNSPAYFVLAQPAPLKRFRKASFSNVISSPSTGHCNEMVEGERNAARLRYPNF